MFEHNEIDKLFVEGLSEVRSFDNEERQWQVVSDRLQPKRRSLFLWLLPLLCLGIFGALYYVYAPLDQLGNQGQLSDNIDSDPSSELKNLATATNLQKIEEQQNLTTKKEINLTNNEETNLDTPTSQHEVINGLSNTATTNTKSSQYRTQEYLTTYAIKSQTLPSNPNSTFKSTSYTKKAVSNQDEKVKSDYSTNTFHSQNSTYGSIVTTATEIKEQHRTPVIDDRSQLNELSPLEQLPFTTLSYQSNITPSPIAPYRQSMNGLKWSLGASIFTEFMASDSVINNRQINWAIQTGIHYSNFSMRIGYRKQAINRLINSELSQYNIIDTTFIYGYERPTYSSLSYQMHLIDVSLGYTMIHHQRWRWGAVAGIQSRKINTGNISLFYTLYGDPIRRDFEIKNRQWELSDIRLGSVVKYDWNPLIGMRLEYTMIQSFNKETIKWPRRHQLELGIIFQLNP